MLFDGNALLVTSTAAGPAFEGATISCGSAAVAGAASHVYLSGGKFRFSVIGGGEAQSLCGSALIDAASILLDAGIVEESGRLAGDAGTQEYRLSEKIAITQKDVRELQTAKAAVAAGVRTLLHEGGVGFDELDAVYLAGGFGNYMDADSAVRIGLLPSSRRADRARRQRGHGRRGNDSGLPASMRVKMRGLQRWARMWSWGATPILWSSI